MQGVYSGAVQEDIVKNYTTTFCACFFSLVLSQGFPLPTRTARRRPGIGVSRPSYISRRRRIHAAAFVRENQKKKPPPPPRNYSTRRKNATGTDGRTGRDASFRVFLRRRRIVVFYRLDILNINAVDERV